MSGHGQGHSPGQGQDRRDRRQHHDGHKGGGGGSTLGLAFGATCVLVGLVGIGGVKIIYPGEEQRQR